MLFIESSGFTEWVVRFLDDITYAILQRELMANPARGDVMPGCGALRKVRVADPRRRKGKRGGARVIYLHVPEADRIFLLDIYGKDEKGDLTPAEKRELKQLANQLKKEAAGALTRRKKNG